MTETFLFVRLGEG